MSDRKVGDDQPELQALVDESLKDGCCVTIEPGLYVLGRTLDLRGRFVDICHSSFYRSADKADDDEFPLITLDNTMRGTFSYNTLYADIGTGWRSRIHDIH